jgi:hypothetical protein
LDEELFREAEELLPSEHKKILTVVNFEFDPQAFSHDLERLRQLTDEQDESGALKQLEAMTETGERSVEQAFGGLSVVHPIDIRQPRKANSIALSVHADQTTDHPTRSRVLHQAEANTEEQSIPPAALSK